MHCIKCFVVALCYKVDANCYRSHAKFFWHKVPKYFNNVNLKFKKKYNYAYILTIKMVT